MIISVATVGLVNAVTIAASLVDSNNKTIVVSGTDGKIEIKVKTNEEIVHLRGLEFHSADITEDAFAPFTIDAKNLQTALKSVKVDMLTIDIQESVIEIKAGRSKIKLEVEAQSEEIEIPSGDKILAIGDELIAGLTSVAHACDITSPKYVFGGISVTAKDGKLRCVSTDTRRMPFYDADTKIDDVDVVVHKKGVDSITRLFKGCSVSAEVTENFLVINTASMSYACRLINDSFPDVERIIPKSVVSSIEIGKAGLEDLLREAMLFNKDVYISIAHGKILMGDFEKVQIEEVAPVADVEMKFLIPGQNIIDSLKYADDIVKISYQGDQLPIRLDYSDNFYEVIMPLSPEQEIPVPVAETTAIEGEVVAA